MQIEMLKSKIHRATVTEAELHYEGSIGIDRTLIDAAGLRVYEKVDVLNIANGNRFTTYVIEQPANSGDIVINGAAAHLANPGDLVIIVAYGAMEEAEADQFKPRIIKVDTDNKVKHG
ncbi:MAG: aspartate 1-decarboxylase [Rickettsiales bacterium]|nr:aspartate 1-decarboxylase [Rickettsiales bacterium]